MLNLIGSATGLAAIAINLVAMATALPLSLKRKLLLAGVVGIWAGLASGFADANALAVTPGHPVPLIGVFFAVPLLAMLLAWRLVPGVRAAMLNIPTELLIGLNIARVLGVLFLFLAAAGRLSGPFPYFAGLGDIITGLGAIPLAVLVARNGAKYGRRIAAWNAFGALDLFVAVGLGVTSADGSPQQLIHAGVGSAAMQHMPYALIPAVLVPFYLITHGIIAMQLRARQSHASPAVLRAAGAMR